MTARVATTAGAWCGRAALLCALGVVAFALLSKRFFLHLGLPAAPSTGALLGEAAADALTLAGAWLGVRALRRGARPGATAAGAALVLLAPFVADALLALPAPLLAGATARRVAFLSLTEALVLTALWATARARRRGPAPGPRPWLRASGRLAARALLLLVALAAATGAAELILRAAGVGVRNYASPMLIVPGDERRVPLSEISLFLAVQPPPPDSFTAYYRPYAFFKGWYDRPTRPYFDAHGQVDYVFNRWGLRDHDFELEKPPGELRVLAAGDSFTFGAGVPREDAWPEVLERELHARLGRAVEVINAGVSGSDPALDEPWLTGTALRLQPDIVVVGLCLNDLHDGVPMFAYEPRRPPRQLFDGRSNLLNALQAALSPTVEGPRTALDVTALVQAEPAMWQRTQAALRHERDVCAAHGVRFVVAPLPMFSGLQDKPYPYAGLLKLVSDFCAAEGIETVDVASRFLGAVDEDLWVHPTDQHPNEVAHRIIAEAIGDGLASR